MNTRQRHERNIAIIGAYNAGESVNILASRYDVTPTLVYQVLREARLSGIPMRSPDRRGRRSNNESRNTEIVEMYGQGLSMQAIGDKYNVSRERIRQILRHAGSTPRSRQHTYSAAYDRWVTLHGAQVNATFGECRSLSKVCHAHPDFPASWVRRLLAPRAIEAIHSPVVPKMWTDDDIIACLRHAPNRSGILTSGIYESWRVSGGKVNGRTPPTHSMICGRFGSWRTAVERAGLRAGRRARDVYHRRWSADDARRAIAGYVKHTTSLGQRPTYAGYSAWILDHPGHPSAPYLRLLTGKSWSANLFDLMVDTK